VTIAVLLDSSVLRPSPLCDFLLNVAKRRLYRPYFSRRILEDSTEEVVQNGLFSQIEAKSYQESICRSCPGSLIEDIPNASFVTPSNAVKNPVILAAAVSGYEHIPIIVTSDSKQFSSKDLEVFGIEAISPDNFLLFLCQEYSCATLADSLKEFSKSKSIDLLHIVSKLEEQCPKFTSEVLLTLYSGRLHPLLKVILRSPIAQELEAKRVFKGNRYSLSETNESISIFSIERDIEILRYSSENISGAICSKDIKILMNAKEAPVYQELIMINQRISSGKIMNSIKNAQSSNVKEII
jgi:hypothetical protein